MTLDRYGAGCRCLLRARENLGHAYVTEDAFIATHTADFPDWNEAPGTANPQRLISLAQTLGIARSGEMTANYDDVVSAHRSGAIVLIRTEQEAKRAAGDTLGDEQFALLVDINASALTIWAPATDGSSETVSYSRAEFWNSAAASALVLR